ncbi:manganese efflux pump MntP family protein [Paenibacillus contaminans]|uniref:Putative manganese efflux pump MntP n=1 Tax=Paenibacillus contaminans TaxID=450362 RepID=A0A329MID0_9BACL|nr:manganese efflux pump [Paenibacillus contaminans]RAV17337.1 manganese efflux pump [Paenibacillus contaminans]
MDTAVAVWGQLATLLVMAFALGLDAFSLGIGIGMKGIRLIHILQIGLITALFHVLMPLCGMFTGYYVGTLLGNVATAAGGGLLLLLGGHMLYSAMKGESAPSFDHGTLWGILLLALTVSIDSFSVGVSFGMFDSDLLLTVLLFGTFGGIMSVTGLWLGRRAGHWVGEYGEAFGGIILLVFGIKFLM